ncbi:MAG: xanthine dehydrogenase family protein subunit M [bacterium]|nr:xanthine dehydrogenase family protein subunit M [bacterium]
MKPFTFIEPNSLDEVMHQLSLSNGHSRLIAGGSDLLGELKEQIVAYDQLVSLAGVTSLRHIQTEGAGLRLGALVTLDELEHDSRILATYGILAEAARGVATPEIRNQGTLGGNLCQRPRCMYYRHALTPCLKKGGDHCPAVDSPFQAYLSVMGGPDCYSVHASDLAPPLMALEAEVTIANLTGSRSIPVEQFFSGPEQDVQRENVLQPGEVLTAVILPASKPGWQGIYVKARERAAGDFPLVSVAVGFALSGEQIQHPRIVLGGVAPVPWRSADAEAVLQGQPATPQHAAEASQIALAGAQPLAHNGFKLEIARTLIARAIMTVASSLQGT